VQGIVLVTFPAAATIFTDHADYGLSSAQYGAMFLPQVVTAIAGALTGARLARRVGTKQVYLAGLTLSLAAMVLLLVSAPLRTDQATAYPLLLVATACVGAGFGLTVPVLNTYASAFRPAAVDSAVLTLNALLGLGTVAAPVFVAIFVGLGFWWGLPAVSAALLMLLLLASVRLPLRVSPVPAARAARAARRGLPGRFWLYAALIGLYGICETMNGNWSQLEMTRQAGASAAQASLALAAFWGMVTLGRVLFALIDRWLPARVAYRLLPPVLIVSFLLTGLLARGQAGAGIFVFGLAGLGCSALLPLTISFGEQDMTTAAAAVSGGIIAFYQVGYGIAAFSVGPLLHAGISLPQIFAGTAAAALALGVLALIVAGRGQRQPAPARPAVRPAGPAVPVAPPASRGAGEVTRPRSG
jgi:fucose permease